MKRITIFAILLLWTVTLLSGCRSLQPRQESDSFFGTPTATSGSTTYIKGNGLQVGTRTSMFR